MTLLNYDDGEVYGVNVTSLTGLTEISLGFMSTYGPADLSPNTRPIAVTPD